MSSNKSAFDTLKERKVKIVSLSGFPGAGKDTAAQVLEAMGFINMKFAKPIKDIVSTAREPIGLCAMGKDIGERKKGEVLYFTSIGEAISVLGFEEAKWLHLVKPPSYYSEERAAKWARLSTEAGRNSPTIISDTAKACRAYGADSGIGGGSKVPELILCYPFLNPGGEEIGGGDLIYPVREECYALSKFLKANFGPAVLTNGALERMAASGHDRFVFTDTRDHQELHTLHALDASSIWISRKSAVEGNDELDKGGIKYSCHDDINNNYSKQNLWSCVVESVSDIIAECYCSEVEGENG